MRVRSAFLLVAVLAAGAPAAAAAAAAALVVTKTSVVVADAVNAANPKALPGAVVDYSLLVGNPNALLSGITFRTVVISDTVPEGTVFNAADYGQPGSGPIEFADGNLLGTGLLGSGVSMSFRGLADDTDGVEFSNGVTWSYHPVAGYDANVRAIRVTLAGGQAAGSAFRLRFRVKVK